MPSGNKGRRSSVKMHEFIDIDGEAFMKVLPFDDSLDGLTYVKHEVTFNKQTIGVISIKDVNLYNISFDKIAASANTLWRPDGLYLHIDAWPGRRGDLFKKAMRRGAKIIPVGTGNIDENSYVRDYRLITFYLEDDDVERDTIL